MTENVISIKDSLYLKDALSWNLQAYKKINDLIHIANDKDVKNALEKVMEMHKSHYNFLLESMKGAQN